MIEDSTVMDDAEVVVVDLVEVLLDQDVLEHEVLVVQVEGLVDPFEKLDWVMHILVVDHRVVGEDCYPDRCHQFEQGTVR